MTLPRLTGSLTYRALVGGDASRRHQIKAIEPPAVAQPEGARRAPGLHETTGGAARDPARIEAWEDSRVTLEIEANRPLKQAEVTWPALAGTSEDRPSGAASSRVVSAQAR